MGKFTKKWNSRLMSILSVIFVFCAGLSLSCFFDSEASAGGVIAFGGLLANWTPGKLIGNFVGNILTPVTNSASTVLNTTGGAAFANSMSGALGGKPMSGADIGNMAKGMQSKGGGSITPAKITWYAKLLNPYKLATPEILVDQDGNEVLNIADKNGQSAINDKTKAAYNWPKIIGFLFILCLLIWIVKKVFFSKRSSGGGSRRRSSRRSRPAKRKGRY